MTFFKSIIQLFLMECSVGFLSVLSYSYPNAPMTFSITAPAHPHATRVAVYPALFFQVSEIVVTFFNQTLKAHLS